MARGVFDTSSFSEKARKDLLSLLESVPGKKNLVLQQSLVGRIELLVKFSTLQEYGVDRIFLLERENVDSSQKNVLFMAHGEKPKQIQAVATQLKRLQQSSQINHDFHVFWVPRKTLLASSLFEEAGILGEVHVGEFPLLFQSLEPDLLSLELDDAFTDLYLRKDPTPVHTAALALMTIQSQHGLFPRLLGKGEHTRTLINLLKKMQSSQLASNSSDSTSVPPKSAMPSSDIDTLLVIDRSTDFSSPLLTQLTYEGLIDELFGITRSQAEIDTSIIGSASESSSQQQHQQQPFAHQNLKRKIRLDASDPLYSSLRDANFAIVGSLLNRVARRLQSDYSERHGQKSTAELRDFVSRLPGYQAEHQSLKIHTSLAEEVLKRTRKDEFRKDLEVQQNLVAGADVSGVQETIEELMARDAPIEIVLRLLCLTSTLNGGLPQKAFDSLRRQVVQAYGHEHILTLTALESIGLLTMRQGSGAFGLPSATSTPQNTSTNYSSLRRPLGLIIDDVSEQDPKDISYVYSGYAPLSIRLVQCVLQKPYLQSLRSSNTPSLTTSTSVSDASTGWRSFENVLVNVKGPTVDETQTHPAKSAKAKQVLEGRGGKKTTVVFFLGGVTFAEVAALRFIARQKEERRRIVIATTGVVSGERMVRTAMAEAKRS
ncbi:MAG: hypothetical protein Q9159_000049 [Coniocarpon cinnabarinum]